MRTAFEGAARELVRVLGLPEASARWDEPSALEGMTVGALASHAARAVHTVQAYLAAEAPVGDALVTAAGYVAGVLGDAGPDDELHVGIRQRAADGAVGGPGAVAESLEAALVAVLATLAETDPDRPVAVRDGIALRIDDYLASRVVELVVHLDDLAVSLEIDVDVPDSAAQVAIDVLADLARMRHGWQHVVRHLARRERATGLVAAL